MSYVTEFVLFSYFLMKLMTWVDLFSDCSVISSPELVLFSNTEPLLTAEIRSLLPKLLSAVNNYPSLLTKKQKLKLCREGLLGIQLDFLRGLDPRLETKTVWRIFSTVNSVSDFPRLIESVRKLEH